LLPEHHLYLCWKAALQHVHRQSLHTIGPLSAVSSGPAGKNDVLLLWHTLLVKKYHSFIDKDSSQPAAEGTFMFEPRNVIGGSP
jgi:hypothetical protein